MQGINYSPPVFASCRDCPSYLVFADTVRDLLLPAEATVREKWLPAESVYAILLSAESRQEAESRGQTRQEASYHVQQPRQETRSRTESAGRETYDWRTSLYLYRHTDILLKMQRTSGIIMHVIMSCFVKSTLRW